MRTNIMDRVTIDFATVSVELTALFGLCSDGVSSDLSKMTLVHILNCFGTPLLIKCNEYDCT